MDIIFIPIIRNNTETTDSCSKIYFKMKIRFPPFPKKVEIPLMPWVLMQGCSPEGRIMIYGKQKLDWIIPITVIFPISMGMDENPEGFQNDSKYKQFNFFLEPSYRVKMGSFAITGNIRFVQNFTNLKTEDLMLDASPFFIN